ncbi:SNF2 domain-containing protein CLASSY 1-like [Syzygium oleosum]|uniref:SNF2 domain-containing protein CLASSY 1-like n=1 Tax=Syzygium oleosum TaxID=219896 RepID=UPI0024B8B74A|nr:SNF2 domain-containing protein CLASSY 1-like [Syzygium oleosum]XP_056169518.1 SNF2 domain-containing protein CLASSY 1-like [Syzygium oleosum]
MGRRRDLYQSKHPFNEYPFEALCAGSWQPVESIRISHGRMIICTVDDRYAIEESGPFTNVRIKSRQATLSDCTCFLRPGVDICVLSPSEKSNGFGELQEPGWVDARISSIERKPHESRCCCQFYVKLYTSKCPLGSEKGVLSKEITLVGIDDICILQRLDSKDFKSQLYRWTYAEDCSLLQRSKLLLGRFLADISWLLSTSALYQIIFNVRSLHNKIVYEIFGRDGRVSFNTDNNLRTLNFKVENEVMIPIVVQHVPTKTSEAGIAFGEHESVLELFSDVMDLRRSKRRNIQPERFLGCDASQLNISSHTTGLYKVDKWNSIEEDTLPGLQSYTLMMNPADMQQQVLSKLYKSRYHGDPRELQLLITLGSIHPWLVKNACCASKFFSRDELMPLEKHKFDIKEPKVKFVLSLAYLVFQKEKVLIFCHNIAPIHLFLEIFENIFGWRKGKEVMVLTEGLDLFKQERVINQFQEPGHTSRILLASMDCAQGISLTAASRVILLDSVWNPSKTRQAITRAFRPGQQKVVYVYQLLLVNTPEEEMYWRIAWKECVSSIIFRKAFVEDPSCWQRNKLEDEILREMVEEDKSKSIHAIMKNEKASTN